MSWRRASEFKTIASSGPNTTSFPSEQISDTDSRFFLKPGIPWALFNEMAPPHADFKKAVALVVPSRGFEFTPAVLTLDRYFSIVPATAGNPDWMKWPVVPESRHSSASTSPLTC